MPDNENKHFIPDEVDEQVDQYLAGRDEQPGDLPAIYTVQTLQHHYAPHRDHSQSLERVWNRFIQSHASLESPQHKVSNRNEQQATTTTQRIRRYRMNQKRLDSHNESTPPSRVAMIAAIVFVTLLVGSAVAVFQMARQGHSGAAGQLGNCTPIASTTGKVDPAQLYAQANNTVYRLDPTTHKALWHFHMHPIGGYVYTTSIGEVMNGVYYTLGTDTDGYYFYALNTTDGSLRWRFKTHNPAQLALTGNQLIINGRVYISEASITDGYSILTTLNASTGAVQWQRRYDGTGTANGQKQSTDFATGLELEMATDTTLYATSSTRKNGTATLALSALSTTNGSSIWQTSINTNEQIVGGQVVDGILYIATWSSDSNQHIFGFIHAYDATNGVQKWSVRLDGQPFRPIALNGAIYIGTYYASGSGGSVYALKAQDGSQLWKYNTQGRISTPVVDNGIVYLGVSHKDGSQQLLMALDTMKGIACWSRSLPDHMAPLDTPLVISKNFIYLSISNDKVDVFSPSDGKLVSTFTVGRTVASTALNYAQLSIVP